MNTFSPPAPPSYTEATPRERTARLLTDTCAPANLVVVVLLLVGWHSTNGFAGLGWGLFAALFCGVVPMGIVLFGVKRGGLTDKHIRVRKQRVVPMTASLASVVTGIVLLRVLHAPKDIAALVVAMLVGLVSALAVTVWWQISIHNAVGGGTAMILILAFGPIAVPALLIAAAIGWSRLVLKAHTLAQVLAGTALGGVSALVFTLTR
ncbi:phosphatase PAP2 family protein [Streptacidiphilus sp. N1-12]|uniref:Phosphatase PAP2 family protein n=2 Tax=Streptacidiphilus alkalitolerans TaxID=3342712 RepID=A0ABV6W950_9ACTN